MEQNKEDCFKIIIKALEDRDFITSPYEVLLKHIRLESKEDSNFKDEVDDLSKVTICQLQKHDSLFLKKELLDPMLGIYPKLKEVDLSKFTFKVISNIHDILIKVPSNKRVILNKILEDRGYCSESIFEIIINFENYIKIEDKNVNKPCKVVMYMLSRVTSMDLRIDESQSVKFSQSLIDIYCDLNFLVHGSFVGGEYWYCPPSKWKRY